MAKVIDTSFDIDVEATKPSAPVHAKPIRTSSPKPRVHKAEEVKKEVKQEELTVLPAPPVAEEKNVESLSELEAKLPMIQVKWLTDSHKSTSSTVEQPAKKDIELPLGIHVDPATAAVVGTLTVAAGATAATTGIAAPAFTAMKLFAIKVKAALGLSSKAALAAGAGAAGVAAMMALEKRFNDYEKDIQCAKSEIDDVDDKIRHLDALLEKVKT